jgi:small-conductance mechanosensitive channel
MLRIVFCLFFLLAAGLPARAQGPAASATAPAPTLSAEQARAAIGVLQDPGQRAALIAALQHLATSPATPAATPSAPAAAEPVAPAPEGTAKAPTLAPDSLAAQIVAQSSVAASTLPGKIGALLRRVTDFPLLWFWAERTATDPVLRNTLLQAVGQAAIGLAIAIAVERAVLLLLQRPWAALARLAGGGSPATEPAGLDETGTEEVGTGNPMAGAEDSPAEPPQRTSHRRLRGALILLRRLPFALLALLLQALPLLAYVIVLRVLYETPLAEPAGAAASLRALGATYFVARVLLVLANVLLSPRTAALRLILLPDDAAALVMRWIRRMVVIGAAGYAVAAEGRVFGVFPAAEESLLKLTALAVHLCLVAAVIAVRRPVAAWLAGRGKGALGQLRRRLAAWWHILAIAFIMGVWVVYAIQLHNGMQALLRFLGLTVLVAVGARLVSIALVGALARLLGPEAGEGALPAIHSRALRYAIGRHVLNLIIAAIAFVVLLQLWGLDSFAWFRPGALGGRVMGTLIHIAIALAIAVAVWEVANGWVQNHLSRLSGEGQGVRAARLRTLLPMLRTVLLGTLLLMLGMTALSEIGVDIGPLLAGAGIVGVAIGFGSQKLVQDVITGLFLLLENAMQVGEVVNLAGLTGVVEHLSRRSIKLRAEDGAVHVIPFSAVTTVTNLTRDFSYAVIEAAVAYKDRYDDVVEVLREIAAAMRNEPRWASEIRDDIDILGLEKFADSSVVIKARIRCGPFGRWAVAREFRRRMKTHFDEHGIEIPFPHQKLIVEQTFPPPGPAAQRAAE